MDSQVVMKKNSKQEISAEVTDAEAVVEEVVIKVAEELDVVQDARKAHANPSVSKPEVKEVVALLPTKRSSPAFELSSGLCP